MFDIAIILSGSEEKALTCKVQLTMLHSRLHVVLPNIASVGKQCTGFTRSFAERSTKYYVYYTSCAWMSCSGPALDSCS